MNRYMQDLEAEIPYQQFTMHTFEPVSGEGALSEGWTFAPVPVTFTYNCLINYY